MPEGAGQAVRPTSERVRQTLFDVLRTDATLGDLAVGLRPLAVLDLFAGSGALGLEALSRGAASVVFVEHSRAACQVIRQNVTTCGFDDRATVRCADWLEILKERGVSAAAKRELEAAVAAPADSDVSCPTGRFDLILCDPPYDSVTPQICADAIAAARVLSRHGLLVIESRAGGAIDAPVGLCVRRRLRAGDTELTLMCPTT